MLRPRISFVMFSALLSHGGGRETWLNNVLPPLVATQKFETIDVYHFGDEESDQHTKLINYANDNVRFIEVRLPVVGGRLRSVHRIARFCVKVIWALRKVPRGQHYVIAVGTFYEAWVLSLLRLTMLRPPKLVVWIRGILIKEINHRHGSFLVRLVGFMERKWVLAADLVISNGLDTKTYYERSLGRHVEAIPNALDLGKFRQIARAAFSDHVTKISYIGRLSEEKGLRSFLQAIEYCCSVSTASTLKFEIVGDGPLRPLVEDFISRHISWPVRYLGPLANENMPAYLQTIDAGVCLTYSKESGGGGVSNGLLELIGARRLVIAWDSPIYRQVLNPDQALYIYEADARALGDAFYRFNEQTMDMANRIDRAEKVLEGYSLEKHVEHLIEYIKN